jgi:poly(A) polymerase
MAQMTLEQAALAVTKRLRQHGHQAFWAGGCVRDMLLGLPPADIDVVTDAVPERIVELFRCTRKVGMQFGVVLVRQGPLWIETATFRSDLAYRDGRRPEGVVFTTAEEDAQRRDFTINGLFYDPLEERVIDYVGGREDLQAGIIRAIGEPARRFAEDHLRLLRAVRFATRFGFVIEPATGAAIREHAAKLTVISAERIREELDKMFSLPSRAESLRLIAELALLPHLYAGAGLTADHLELALTAMAHLPGDADFALSMAAMLHMLAVEDVQQAGRGLRCSNQQTDETVWLVRHATVLDEAGELPLARFKRLLAHPRFEDLLALYRAVCAAQQRPDTGAAVARQRRARLVPETIKPAPLVTGDDLIAAGLAPGPRFKRILDELYDAQLNEELLSREAALQRMHESLARESAEPS